MCLIAGKSTGGFKGGRPPYSFFFNHSLNDNRRGNDSLSFWLFAPHDVIDIRDREAMLFDAPLPRIVKPFDTIGRKYQVQIERAVSELNEILTPANLLLFFFGEPEANLHQGTNQIPAVGGLLLHIEIDILSGVRKPQQYGPRLAKEQVLYAVMLADTAKLLCVLEFKDRHARSQVRL